MYINKVTLYGNLTKDPELKSLPNGTHVSSFSVATNRAVKDQSGARKDVPEYHNVVAFGKQAELIHQYIKKGNPIYLDGRIQTRSWDGQDGKKQYRTEVVLENFQFGPKGTGSGAGAAGGGYNSSSAHDSDSASQDTGSSDIGTVKYPDEEINPEDIPF
ncbi:MAG: single-stranded DNA-binding protein [Patescibacteria group bacterium]